MKRSVIILLLLSFCYHYFGANFVYETWLYTIKEEVKEKLEQEYPEEEKVIKIPMSWAENPPSEFQWHEESEFKYRGQMYDVIRKENRGDMIWYYCYWDKAETKLLNNLSTYVSNYLQENPKGQQKHASLKQDIEPIFLISSNQGSISYLEKGKLKQSEDLKPFFIFLDIETPPPRKAV